MPLVEHPRLGCLVDPDTGLVIGRSGMPIGSTNTNGYRQIDLRYLDLGLTLAHVVVWEAIHGPVPEGMEINHENGDKKDNRLSNLALTTRSGNMAHAFANGLHRAARGEANGNARISEGTARKIIERLDGGETSTAIARSLGVPVTTISNIKNGGAWAHLRAEMAVA